jgi:predicted branched-subunit amino acid permease
MSADTPRSEQLSAPRRAQVVRQAVSVGVATGAYGVSFGALSVTAGLSVLQTCALSLLLFSGGSQFAFIGVIGAGGSGIAAVATSTLLGLRNGLYGLQLTRLLGLTGWRRLVGAQLTIDESTAVAVVQPEPPASRLGFWLTGASVFVLWNLMTLAGAVVGNALGDPRRYGLDAASGAAFLGLLWPRLRSGEPRVVAALAFVVAAALSPVVPAGVPVLSAGLVAVVVGMRSRDEGVAEAS